RISKLGDLKIIAVGEYKQSDTALTGSKGWYANSFVKLEKPLGPDAKLTVLSSYNQNFIHQADGAGGATCTAGSIAGASVNGPYPETDGKNCAAGSQVATYGKQFALVDSSMLASSMWPGLRSDWNWQRKVTDFEEARLQWNINDHISIDNKAYTYFYKNFTVSTDATTLKATGKANESFYGVTPCALTYGGTQCWASATQAVTGTFLTPSSAAGGYGYTNDASLNGHMPGYTKLNQYRQIGDILEMTIKTSAGIGKLGFWYEHSRSHRYQYDYDFTAGAAAGGLSDGTFNFNIMNQNYDYNVADKSYNTMSNGQYVPSYIKYDERTGWENYQVFGEFALKLLDDTLTLTPGVKVTSYSRTINTPIASQSSRSSQFNHDNYKPVLPYFTANYLLKPNWSFYGQYAKGFLMPSLGNSLESVVQNPTTGAITCPSSGCNLQPTKTKNYQLGTVYAGDRVNVDADVYYIQTSNSTSVDPSTNQAVQTAGPAEYQGVEGQISYVLMHGLTAIANGALMSSKDKTTHLWLSQSPNYVATLGAVYGGSRFKLSYLHKFTGRQFADTAQLYRIAPYTKGTLSAAFKLGPAWLGVSVDNVFNDTSVTKLGSSSSTTSPATSAPNTALPVAYYYQSPRSYQVNLKVRY
ncbi:MAG TPA: TonB-dependent receptor, partial [Novosphingobium sp.]|nr:TonB-dependent receptor [Novosphingobium sp.]